MNTTEPLSAAAPGPSAQSPVVELEPVFPPEILVNVAEYAALETCLRLATLKKDLYFLIIPIYVKKKLLQGFLNSEDAVRRFAEDKLGDDANSAEQDLDVSQFRLVRYLGPSLTPENCLWLSRAGILGRLTLVSQIEAENLESEFLLGDMPPNLERLHLSKLQVSGVQDSERLAHALHALTAKWSIDVHFPAPGWSEGLTFERFREIVIELASWAFFSRHSIMINGRSNQDREWRTERLADVAGEMGAFYEARGFFDDDQEDDEDEDGDGEEVEEEEGNEEGDEDEGEGEEE